ncbi:MAG: hypothetical protein IKI97_05050 [Clostridia bacterium]|nr:hypothetical protein [Clostridia bacterium]
MAGRGGERESVFRMMTFLLSGKTDSNFSDGITTDGDCNTVSFTSAHFLAGTKLYDLAAQIALNILKE